MTFNHKNNNTNKIGVFKLFKNEVLHKILWLILQKFKMAESSPFRFMQISISREKMKRRTYICASDLILHIPDLDFLMSFRVY